MSLYLSSILEQKQTNMNAGERVMEYVVRDLKDKERLVQAYGDWLCRYDWKWFAMFTFPAFYYRDKKEVKMKTYVAERWLKTYLSNQGERIFYFSVIESTPVSLHYHAHVLIGGISDLRVWKCGVSEIFPYDKKRGAVFYIAKTIPHGNFYWDFKLD